MLLPDKRVQFFFFLLQSVETDLFRLLDASIFVLESVSVLVIHSFRRKDVLLQVMTFSFNTLHV